MCPVYIVEFLNVADFPKGFFRLYLDLPQNSGSRLRKNYYFFFFFKNNKVHTCNIYYNKTKFSLVTLYFIDVYKKQCKIFIKKTIKCVPILKNNNKTFFTAFFK